MTRTGFAECRGRLEDLDRTFDLKYWQGQSAAARAMAAWELALHAAKSEGLDVCQLRFQRTVETYQQQEH